MNKFYNGKRVLSFGTPFIFSLGNRSIGKTFYWTTRCIKKYLKSGEQFIYVRRYDNDLKRVAPSFFENVSFKFPDVSLRELKVAGEVEQNIISMMDWQV